MWMGKEEKKKMGKSKIFYGIFLLLEWNSVKVSCLLKLIIQGNKLQTFIQNLFHQLLRHINLKLISKVDQNISFFDFFEFKEKLGQKSFWNLKQIRSVCVREAETVHLPYQKLCERFKSGLDMWGENRCFNSQKAFRKNAWGFVFLPMQNENK